MNTKQTLSQTGKRSLLALALFTSQFLVLPASRAQEVELFYTDQTDLDWNDSESGAKISVSFWRPRYPAGQNIDTLCHTGRPDYGTPPGMVVAKKLTPTAFASPVSFTAIWNDAGSGASLDGYVWRPVPPAGYRSLGDVVTGSSTAPAPTSVVCVRSDLVVEGTVGDQIWNDTGSGADSDISTWKIAAPAGAIDIGAFVATAGYGKPTGPVYCLKASGVELPVPDNEELELLIQQFGPIVKFHPDEVYLPDDPAVILNDPNTRLVAATIYPVEGADPFPEDDKDKFKYDNWSLTTLATKPTAADTILDDVQSVFSHPLANDPHFTYYLSYSESLKGGNLSRAKAYVRVQAYQGALIELQFWMFCPWNSAGKSRVDIPSVSYRYFDPTGTMGRHFSDWESVRVRITSKNVWDNGNRSLASVLMSQHGNEQELAATDSRLAKQGTNPIIY